MVTRSPSAAWWVLAWVAGLGCQSTDNGLAPCASGKTPAIYEGGRNPGSPASGTASSCTDSSECCGFCNTANICMCYPVDGTTHCAGEDSYCCSGLCKKDTDLCACVAAGGRCMESTDCCTSACVNGVCGGGGGTTSGGGNTNTCGCPGVQPGCKTDGICCANGEVSCCRSNDGVVPSSVCCPQGYMHGVGPGCGHACYRSATEAKADGCDGSPWNYADALFCQPSCQ